MSFDGEFEIKDLIIANSYSEIHSSIPSSIKLSDAYPNPFNPITNIEFSITQEEYISIKIYDVMGKLVDILADNQKFERGNHILTWNASSLTSGLYFIRAESKNNISVQKVTLLK